MAANDSSRPREILDTMTPEMLRAQRDGEALFRAFFAIGMLTIDAVKPRKREPR